MAQCSPLIRASQKPSETLQVARAQAAASSSSDRFARGFKRLLRGTSYIFSPNRKDKDRCVPPSRRLVPAWGLLPARAGLILHLLLLPFLLALECPRKVRQALRRHLHAGRRTGSGRCGWRRSKRSRRLRPWLARLLRRRFTLLDLHVEEVAHRFVIDARHHVFEQDEGFLLEFDKWILLAVATKPDALLQMVERKQVVFPLRVDDI